MPRTMTMCHRVLHCWILSLFILSTQAQSLPKTNHSGNFRFYGSSEGFYANRVTDIEQDSLGFLWVGTSEGLVKYDGQNFLSFDLDKGDSKRLNAHIDKILKSKEGDLWIASSDGVVRYNHITGRFTDVALPDNEEAHTMHLTEDVYNNIWIAGSKGLYIHDKKGHTTRVHEKGNDKRIIAVVQADDAGNVWALMHDYVYRYDARTHRAIDSIKYSDQRHFNDNVVISAVLDQHGNLWWGKYNGEIYRLNIQTKAITYFDSEAISGLKTAPITKIYTNKQGKIWFCIDEAGVFYYDNNTGKFNAYVSRELNGATIPCYKITSFFIDRENNNWIGMVKNGLAMSNSQLNLFGKIDLPSHSKSTMVSIAFKDSNRQLWVGTDGGGLHLYDSTFRWKRSFTYRPEDKLGLQNDAILTVYEDSKRRLWVGSFRGGLSLYNPTNETFKTYLNDPGNPNSLMRNDIRKIVEDKEGNLWLAVHGRGVSCFHPETDTFVNYPAIESPWTFDVFVASDQSVWVGTERGVFRKTKHEHQFSRFPSTSSPNSLADQTINTLHEYPKGRIWIGSVHGLYYHDRGSTTLTEVKIVPRLRKSSVKSIAHDRNGNLYVATNRGLFRFNSSATHCVQYGIEEGLYSEDFNNNACQLYNQETLFFGTSKGVCYLEPDKINSNDVPFTPIISDIRIFDKSILPGSDHAILDKQIQYISSISLSYKQNHVLFEFACPIYSHSIKNLRFQYFLEGFDNVWQNCGISRTAVYSNLPPGNYQLNVRVIKDDYIYSKKKTLLLYVAPPFWETWVFRISAACVAIGFVLALYFWRTRTIRKHNLQLHREVALQTNSLRQKNEEIKQTSEEITRLYSSLTESIEAAQVIQTAILPGKWLMEEYFEAIEILYRPKDVVSGDFYWCEKKGNRYILAIGDCTGHGVAGAFMTFIGYETLNQVVRENAKSDAGQLLSQVNKEIISSLNRYKSANIQAGMDLSLCIYDKERRIIEFAGSNLPMYVVRNKELIVYKGDRQGIGGKQKEIGFSFRTSTVSVQPKDQIYLFTDGYADQIGGPDGQQKLMYPRFRQTLLDIESLPLKDRIHHLETLFDKWRNGEEQLDDVLVIGFEIA